MKMPHFLSDLLESLWKQKVDIVFYSPKFDDFLYLKDLDTLIVEETKNGMRLYSFYPGIVESKYEYYYIGIL